MPLTKAGRETKRAMSKEYGAKKGESVFYAFLNKKTSKQQSKFHGKSPKK